MKPPSNKERGGGGTMETSMVVAARRSKDRRTFHAWTLAPRGHRCANLFPAGKRLEVEPGAESPHTPRCVRVRDDSLALLFLGKAAGPLLLPRLPIVVSHSSHWLRPGGQDNHQVQENIQVELENQKSGENHVLGPKSFALVRAPRSPSQC